MRVFGCVYEDKGKERERPKEKKIWPVDLVLWEVTSQGIMFVTGQVLVGCYAPGIYVIYLLKGLSLP